MFLETGYVYHIKDEYFEFVKDDKFMKNLIFPDVDKIEKLLLEELSNDNI